MNQDFRSVWSCLCYWYIVTSILQSQNIAVDESRLICIQKDSVWNLSLDRFPWRSFSCYFSTPSGKDAHGVGGRGCRAAPPQIEIEETQICIQGDFKHFTWLTLQPKSVTEIK